MPMWCSHLVALGCTPDSGSRFGGSLSASSNFWCMPGPISGPIGGYGKLFCADVVGNNGTFISDCDHPLYNTVPATLSSEDYSSAQVTPGPNCTPDSAYTELGGYVDSFNNTKNQLDSEPCNCHGFGIRLAINTGSEQIDSKQSKAFATKVGGLARDLTTHADSPCAFRSASFAWDFPGDNSLFKDNTVMSMNANRQGKVHPLLFNPDGTQFADSAAADETSKCDPETVPTCGNSTVHSPMTQIPSDSIPARPVRVCLLFPIGLRALHGALRLVTGQLGCSRCLADCKRQRDAQLLFRRRSIRTQHGDFDLYHPGAG